MISRRIVENAFGILASRWRIFRRPLIALPETATKISLAAVSLHNFLRVNESAVYCSAGFVDVHEENSITLGTWRQDGPLTGLLPMAHSGGNYTRGAASIRDIYKLFYV